MRMPITLVGRQQRFGQQRRKNQKAGGVVRIVKQQEKKNSRGFRPASRLSRFSPNHHRFNAGHNLGRSGLD